MYKIYNSVSELPPEWDSLVQHDVFLKTPYLIAAEAALPLNFKVYYIGIFSNSTLVGVAIVQHVALYLKDMFRPTNTSCIRTLIRSKIAPFIKGNILVVGNLMHTGQHGFFFNASLVPIDLFLETVYKAILVLSSSIKQNQNIKIQSLLFKDFFESDINFSKHFFWQHHKFQKLTLQPNMILDIRKDWALNTDYVSSFSKKYKDRYNRARKKLQGVHLKELDIHDIKQNESRLNQLYLTVSSHAKFNTFVLPDNHFYQLKLNMGDAFKVFAFYLNSTIIGFYTLILNKETLETYFLGYDIKYQHEKQVYLNMLFKMVEFGVLNKYKTIVFARTAMEIKSSVGAHAHTMVIYIKHTNRTLNYFLSPIFKLMNPKNDWELRHPFKN